MMDVSVGIHQRNSFDERCDIPQNQPQITIPTTTSATYLEYAKKIARIATATVWIVWVQQDVPDCLLQGDPALLQLVSQGTRTVRLCQLVQKRSDEPVFDAIVFDLASKFGR